MRRYFQDSFRLNILAPSSRIQILARTYAPIVLTRRYQQLWGHNMKRFNLIVIVWFACASAAVSVSAQSPVAIQILAINDFHGNLEPPTGSNGKISGIDAGGAEYLATHLKSLRFGHLHTITVSAGDLFGASPLLSALFKEEPTIQAMNLMGLDLNAVGNHEFDKGWRELLRVANPDIKRGYGGANFDFLAANVIVNATGKTLFPAYEIREFGDAKVAFVGVVVERVDLLVTEQAIDGLTFLPEADAVNDLIPELEAQGIHSIVVMVHEGGYPTGGFNDCPGISGPIVDIANHMHDNVGIILSGHTHQAYNCKIGNKLVTSAASHGRLVTNVELVVDAESQKIIRAQADNIVVTRTVEKDNDQSVLIKHYKDISAPIAHRIIGVVKEDLPKATNDAGESVLGRLVADAQLAATLEHKNQIADVAFMNPGGLRADIMFTTSKAAEGDGNITFSELFAVQPFGNNLITMTLRGAQIIDVLEQQFAGCGFDQTRVLAVSKSLTYQYHTVANACEKVDRTSILINGKALDVNRSYRVVANNFLASGGDGFSAFKQGIERVTGVIDTDALESYVATRSPLHADREARITRID